MDRSSSSSSIGRITPNKLRSDENKKPDNAEDKAEKPSMVSKKENQDAVSKRATYGKSKASSQTKASQNLPRFAEEKSARQNQLSRSTSSSLVSSSSASSSESDEEELMPSTAPTLRATSSTANAASTSSTTKGDSHQEKQENTAQWSQFEKQAAKHSGVFMISKKMDIDAVCRWLASSPPGVRTLDGNRINQAAPSDWIKLFTALNDNTTLTTLNLADNHIGADGARALAEAFKGNTTLTTLSLCYAAIGDDGAKALAEAFKGNTTLTTLDLGSVAIGDDGAKALAEAFKDNSTLTTLDLRHNAIGDDGAKAFAEALKVNTTLTNVKIDSSDYDDDIDAELKKNRQLKKEKENAKAALELINFELGKTDNPGLLFLEGAVMDQIVDQMAQVGLKDEIIGLGESIKLKKT